MSNYQTILNSKRDWSVSEINANDSGRPEGNFLDLISKITALGLTLELPVGEFIGQATKRELPSDPVAKPLLLRNIKEETRHYRAFQNVAKVYPAKTEHLKVAEQFLVAWDSHADHPVIKAGVLELGVFLVSLAAARIYGSQSLERIVVDINLDEQTHIAANWQVAEDLDLSYSRSLDKLRLSVVDWLFSGLSDSKYPLDFWVRQSNSFMESFEAPELQFLDYEPRISFFEISGEYLPGYAEKLS